MKKDRTFDCQLVREDNNWFIRVDEVGVFRELDDETSFMEVRESIEGELIANGEEEEDE